jgi:hypothetical protein
MTLRVTLPTVPTSRNQFAADGLVLRLEENMHETAIIGLKSVPKETYPLILSGLPITIDYNYLGVFRTFWGHVHHTQMASGLVLIYCVGTTFWLKQPGNAVFEPGTSLSEIFASVLRRSGLDWQVFDDTSLVRPLVQTGSDWNLLTRAADMTGRAVRAHGTRLECYDPYNQAQRYTPVGPIRPISPVMHSRGSFAPKAGKYWEQIGGIDDQTGEDMLLERTSTSAVLGSGEELVMGTVISRRNHQVTVVSADDASQALDSLIKWGTTATIETDGALPVVPGRSIEVVSQQSGVSGTWYVTAAMHKVSLTENTTTSIHVARNDTGNNEGPQFVTAKPYQIPAARLHGDEWRAE